MSSPSHRECRLKGGFVSGGCVTSNSRKAGMCQWDGRSQRPLSTHPSGQGSQWSWAARPLWVPAGQGLGVTVPGGQKCPEREEDQTGQGQRKPSSPAL